MKKLIFGIALIGMGGFAMAQQTQPTAQQKAEREARRMEMQQKNTERRAQHLEQIKQELNLSDAQMTKLRAMQDRKAAERKGEMQKNQEMRKEKMAMMKEKRQQHNNEMKQILTPEQFQKWEANRKAKMQERKEKFQDRKDVNGMEKRKMHKKVRPANAS